MLISCAGESRQMSILTGCACSRLIKYTVPDLMPQMSTLFIPDLTVETLQMADTQRNHTFEQYVQVLSNFV